MSRWQGGGEPSLPYLLWPHKEKCVALYWGHTTGALESSLPWITSSWPQTLVGSPSTCSWGPRGAVTHPLSPLLGQRQPPPLHTPSSWHTVGLLRQMPGWDSQERTFPARQGLRPWEPTCQDVTAWFPREPSLRHLHGTCEPLNAQQSLPVGPTSSSSPRALLAAHTKTINSQCQTARCPGWFPGKEESKEEMRCQNRGLTGLHTALFPWWRLSPGLRQTFPHLSSTVSSSGCSQAAKPGFLLPGFGTDTDAAAPMPASTMRLEVLYK